MSLLTFIHELVDRLHDRRSEQYGGTHSALGVEGFVNRAEEYDHMSQIYTRPCQECDRIRPVSHTQNGRRWLCYDCQPTTEGHDE